MIVIDKPTLLKIQSLYAFIAQDEQGNEGVCGMMTGDGWVPLVGADTDRIKSLMPFAEQIAKQSNVKIKLCLFTTRTEISEIKP